MIYENTWQEDLVEEADWVIANYKNLDSTNSRVIMAEGIKRLAADNDRLQRELYNMTDLARRWELYAKSLVNP